MPEWIVDEGMCFTVYGCVGTEKSFSVSSDHLASPRSATPRSRAMNPPDYRHPDVVTGLLAFDHKSIARNPLLSAALNDSLRFSEKNQS